jgi:hypothetical protein
MSHAATRLLEGNGVEMIRERALAARVQAALERLYRLDRVADVHDFLEPAAGGERETLLVQELADGAVGMTLRVPQLEEEPASLDALCQIIEGVSHFVYLTDRVRARRESTQLELELQAEVDKYVVLAASVPELDARSSERIRARLFEHVRFVEEHASERGERYRVANDHAHRFLRRLERDHVANGRLDAMRDALRRFYEGGQEDKLRLGRAA